MTGSPATSLLGGPGRRVLRGGAAVTLRRRPRWIVHGGSLLSPGLVGAALRALELFAARAWVLMVWRGCSVAGGRERHSP
jgi:hypothetical protein